MEQNNHAEQPSRKRDVVVALPPSVATYVLDVLQEQAARGDDDEYFLKLLNVAIPLFKEALSASQATDDLPCVPKEVLCVDADSVWDGTYRVPVETLDEVIVLGDINRHDGTRAVFATVDGVHCRWNWQSKSFDPVPDSTFEDMKGCTDEEVELALQALDASEGV